MLKQLSLLILLLIFSAVAHSQSYSNIRTKSIAVSDSLIIDTLSLVETSIYIFDDNKKLLDDSLYHVDCLKSKLYFTSQTYDYPKHITITYRVFPILFSGIYPTHSNNIWQITDTSQNSSSYIYKQYSVSKNEKNTLLANGNISRGISVGNNQDLVVNSNLNLQLSGKISDNIFIEAYLSDKNIPVQPDGYSQQIQEFDKIYIRLFDSTTYLQMGDVSIKGTNSYFLQFSRSIMGGDFGHTQKQKSKYTSNTQISGAIAKGTFNRSSFTGIEAVQGPYSLTGLNNETYIIILAGSENIYIDGQLLERGENADYVINYNTAELTFTSKHMITKDTRIIAEFEYSTNNYNRFLLYGQNTTQFKKGSFSVQYFNESDAKNQPVDMELSSEYEQILIDAGDDPYLAIVPNYDSVDYDVSIILYKLVDTTVNGVFYDSILVHSYDVDSAIYSAGFAIVGENNGSYITDNTLANGQVYKWVAPENGIPQGNYEPVQLLIAPVKHQVIVANMQYQLFKNTNANIEVALSKKDKNSFSSLDSYDNKGMAFKVGVQHKKKLKKNSLLLSTNYESLSEHFNGVDRFKSAEFNRDWNLSSTSTAKEHLLEAEIALQNKKSKTIAFKSQYLNRPSIYEGIKNELQTNIRFIGFSFKAKANLLNSRDTSINTTYYRHYISLNKNLGIFNLTLGHDYENNLQNYQNIDSLYSESIKYSSWKGSMSLPDTLKRNFSISYTHRNDYSPLNNQLILASQTQDISFTTKLTKSRMNQLQTIITWRELKVIQEDLLPTLENENNFIGRIDHNLRFKKNWLSLYTFYEVGTGLETSKEYSYLEVATGQGVYIWVDYDSDGIPQLDEFEVSAFTEEANYIRIYTSTDDYIKVYSLKLNETIKLDPGRVWRNKKGYKNLISRFSNTATIQINQKHTNEDIAARLNPFITELADTQLVSQTFNYRNILSFNRINPVFGIDWVYQNRNQKTFISNGFEQTQLAQNEIKMRWNITKKLLIVNSITIVQKQYESDYFSEKNYQIKSIGNNTLMQWQPSNTFRIALTYNYKQKENLWGDENSIIHKAGPEVKYSWPKKGSVNVSAKIINVNYSGDNSTTIAYEMMEGYTDGENYQWGINISRKLNKYLQLTVNYNGRKPAASQTIHTGTFNLSALF